MNTINNNLHVLIKILLLNMLMGLGISTVATAQQSPRLIINDATLKIIQESFEDQGTIKGKEREKRIMQTELQRACTDVARSFSGKKGQAYYLQLLDNEMSSVRYPTDGNYLGDWKAGNALAQNGKGLTWRNKPDAKNGGGCYNCHQLSPKELSYGTIGPSLYQYGKKRQLSEAVLKTTWAHIWNPKAFNVCSWMPRFGQEGILSMDQIRDLMALLLDSNSIVNQ